MREAFQKIGKICLFIALILLIMLLVFGVVLIFDWPWWVAVFLILLLGRACDRRYFPSQDLAEAA